MERKPTFGYKKEKQYYTLRPSCYAVIFNDQYTKIAIIKKGTRYFLPGGGMEQHETKELCLRRELVEELGWHIEIQHYIGNAERYFCVENENTYYLNDGYFYICKKLKTENTISEQDHILQWLSPSQAQRLLVHEHQQWAVKQALSLQK
ncbi:NUDIX hydrolase [Bacillus pseudomycoides]|uniref:NUDIX hydrolase n=1 Tax=Bacillus pseudomycoides TaxID=64104 RepID=UPI000BED2CD7|nr:NUDIX domain-containing protein [Bacillus pseudomycoides]PDY47255.1 DNA mismatch repair protein MutT [Bacillus pseudomycoides]PED05519.1 DNA mismatch repair protein MutT [Bacillus pseudomycoides]PED71518.1 DNA mismatch repair protein MutT [Bacillus pseudomycoides]PEI47192.1 DNA mismatch repair protein MutT [Bacillus pseudomycoides]PEI96923.1 DNA mismatch repair protein MutT [Bacillus pseudomycoides]